MSDTIISVERLSKRYKLGEIGASSLREATERLWLDHCFSFKYNWSKEKSLYEKSSSN